MLRMPKCSIEREFEGMRAFDIIPHLEESNYSLESCEWAIRSFISFTGNAMQQNNTEAMADFLDDEGCETLVIIMQKYAAMSESIAANCCLIVCILSWSLRDMKEFLGDIGACELVVFATSMHIGDPLVSLHGSGAIGLLAKDNISNSYKIAESGACDVISQVGNFGLNIRDPKCVEVATNVCYAIAELCEASNSTRLSDCGACALLVLLLRLHIADPDFATAAVKALCGLSSLHVRLREELGKSDGCKFTVELLRVHKDSVDIAQQACEAIMHLSLNPNNATKLSEVGACEEVVNALNHKLMNVELGAEVCSGAMLNLATYGVNAKEGRIALNKAGAVSVIRGAQMSSKVSYHARERILNLLELLGADCTIPGAMSTSTSTQSLQQHQTVTMRTRTSSAVSEDTVSPGSRVTSKDDGRIVEVLPVTYIHGSEMKGDTIPLRVEIREEIEYTSTTEASTLNSISPLASTTTSPVASSGNFNSTASPSLSIFPFSNDTTSSITSSDAPPPPPPTRTQRHGVDDDPFSPLTSPTIKTNEAPTALSAPNGAIDEATNETPTEAPPLGIIAEFAVPAAGGEAPLAMTKHRDIAAEGIKGDVDFPGLESTFEYMAGEEARDSGHWDQVDIGTLHEI